MLLTEQCSVLTQYESRGSSHPLPVTQHESPCSALLSLLECTALTWPVHGLAGVRVADEVVVRAPEEHGEGVGAAFEVGSGVKVAAQEALTLRQLLHLPGRVESGRKAQGGGGAGEDIRRKGMAFC